MDLIYMNAEKEDLGVLQKATLDLAFGTDENDFECKVSTASHCCEAGYYLYYEGTEYGGMIDDIDIDTEAEEITYYGRTWHGILDSKILEPDAGENHLILSGEVNKILAFLIDRMGLSSLFRASEEESGINISDYKMSRYIKGYQGIRKMLKASGAKLNLTFKRGFAELSAKPIIDYSKNEQFDTDQIGFKISKKYHPLNHVICLGKGDLAEREVIHVYADKDGNISDTQVFFGLDEVADTYEYANAESSEELRQGGIDMIREAWEKNEVNFNFNADENNYDIGDIVGAKERMTGIEVSTEITKKIIKIQDDTVTVSYEKGD